MVRDLAELKFNIVHNFGKISLYFLRKLYFTLLQFNLTIYN